VLGSGAGRSPWLLGNRGKTGLKDKEDWGGGGGSGILSIYFARGGEV